jgi:chemotaxis-related protein WspB
MSKLYLLFRVGESAFAMHTSEVVEVLPLLSWTAVPQSARGVAGMFVYRGTPVPLIDLSQIISGSPAASRMSTRIVLIRQNTSGRLIGLIAENATVTLRVPANEFQHSGVLSTTPYLGPVVRRGEGMVQQFDVELFLKSDYVQTLLRSDVCN